MESNDGKYREHIKPGLTADIVLKQDQRTGKTTRGVVKEILTKSAQHPHGIKVRLQDGQVGRVKRIIHVERADRSKHENAGENENGETT